MNEEAVRDTAIVTVFWAEVDPRNADPNPDGSKGWRAIAGRPPAIACAIEAPPQGVSAIVKPERGVALTLAAIFYDHRPTEQDLRAPPAFPAQIQPVEAVATPLDGRFHPRRFATPALGAALNPPAQIHLPFWPTPQATNIGEAGAVALNLRWTDNSPASWAILSLQCVRATGTFNFAGQADINGDVIVPLTGLSPRPASQASDDVMSYAVRADPASSGVAAPDPDAFPLVQLSIDGGASFAPQQNLPTPRGRISTAKSLGVKSARIDGADVFAVMLLSD